MCVKVFQVIEYANGFAVRHIVSGIEKWLGDGVDTLFADDQALIPGTEGFVEQWTEVLNEDGDETFEAYFHSNDFYDDGECPDCGTPITIEGIVHNDACENCGHVFSVPQADD